MVLLRLVALSGSVCLSYAAFAFVKTVGAFLILFRPSDALLILLSTLLLVTLGRTVFGPGHALLRLILLIESSLLLALLTLLSTLGHALLGAVLLRLGLRIAFPLVGLLVPDILRGCLGTALISRTGSDNVTLPSLLACLLAGLAFPGI